MSHLTLALLGSFQVTLDEEPVTAFESDKVRALLAYLAVEAEQAHRRETLVGLLWPERTERNARQNLSQALFNLRQAIGDRTASPPFLLITPQTIQFDPAGNYRLDVAQFAELLAAAEAHDHHQLASCISCLEQMQQAVALYEGNFLEGFSLGDSAAFEEWVLLKRERFQRLVVETLHRLADGYRQHREYEQAILYARQQVELDPWREQAHQQLMTLLALNGQRSEALAQYETCRRLLAEDLGVEPAEETSTLYEQIKAGLFDVPATASALPAFLSDDVDGELESTVFVARKRELAQLEARLETALAGQGQTFFVTGGAGRGKTALIQEFARRAQNAQPDLMVISGYCSAHTGIGDPYLPFREALTMLSGEVEAKWAGGLITQDHARRLWTAMPLTLPTLIEVGPDLIDSFVPGQTLQARALTFATPEQPWFRQLTAMVADDRREPLRQERLFAQYTAALKTIAAQQPIVLIIEDLHWVDTSSTSLLFHLSREIKDSRILIVATYRPEEVVLDRGQVRHPVTNIMDELKRQHGDIWLDLSRVIASEGRQFIDALVDTQPNKLDRSFREDLYQRTAGHPLFAVELLRDMQTRGNIYKDEAGQWRVNEAVDWQPLPAKVEGVIAQRLGRLEAELQSVLNVASVEGELFTAEVIAQVQTLDERGLVQRLSRELDRQHRLVMAQALARLDPGGQRLSLYRFRHHLYQHHLYQNLHDTERAYLHQAVGTTLERIYGDQTARVAVQLARHFEQARLTEKAIDYLLQAGQEAARLSAHQEAIAHLTKGLDLLETLPTGLDRVQQELGLQIVLGYTLVAAKGYAVPEVEQAFDRARILCRQIEEPSQLIHVLRGLAVFYLVRADFQIVRELAEQMQILAHQQQDTFSLPFANGFIGMVLFHFGEFISARETLEQTLVLYNPQQHYNPGLSNQDIGVTNLVFLAESLWVLGYPVQALERQLEALELARELSHPLSLAFAHFYAGVLCEQRREVQAAREHGEMVLALATEHDFIFWQALGLFNRGWVLAMQGQLAEGIAIFQQGLAAFKATGARLFITYRLAQLAELLARAEQIEAGLSLVDEGLNWVEQLGERVYEAQFHRLKGELLLLQGSPATGAEACFLKAIEIAQSQQAKSLELRATMSLGRLWQKQDKTDRAQQMLAEIYGWFTEGFDTPDLQDAKALLKELSSD